MGVVKAKIQTADDIYRLIWTARLVKILVGPLSARRRNSAWAYDGPLP
jgi:hypothetical protein